MNIWMLFRKYQFWPQLKFADVIYLNGIKKWTILGLRVDHFKIFRKKDASDAYHLKIRPIFNDNS